MNRMFRFARQWAIFGFCGQAAACGVEVLGDAGEGRQGIPADVQAAFDRSCATEFCHSAKTLAGGISLAAAEAEQILLLQSRTSPQALRMVEFGDLNASYLAVKMLAEPPPGVDRVGTRMPPLWDERAEADAAVIFAWIEGGGGSEVTGEAEGESASAGEAGEDDLGGPRGPCFGPAEGSVLPEQLVLHDHIVPIIDARCLGEGCHAGMVELAPYLDCLRIFEGTVNVPSASAGMNLITPGSPEQSYLWHKIAGSHAQVSGGGGTAMPPGGGMCASEVTAIYNWILSGARR